MENNFYLDLQDGGEWDEFPKRGSSSYIDRIVKYFEFTIGDIDYSVRAEVDVDYDRFVMPADDTYPGEDEVDIIEYGVHCTEGHMSNQGNSLPLNEKQLNELSGVIGEHIIFLPQ